MQPIDGSAGTGSAVAYGDVGWVNMPLQTGWFLARGRRQIFEKIRNDVRAEDRSYPRMIVAERLAVGRDRQRHRKSQSECSCDGGELGLTGSWSELSKLACENDGGHWRTEAG